jgi:hypothetical protein
VNEPADLLGPLQRLAAEGAYRSAVAELAAARDESDTGRRLERVRGALLQLEQLASPVQHLAWLTTFGSPRCVRLDEAAVRELLWRRGVNRSTDGLPYVARAARLLAAVAIAEATEVEGLLCRLRGVGAFDALAASEQPAWIAAEAVGLVLAVDPAAIHRLAAAATAAEIKSVAAASLLAAWMHALATAGAPDVAPPETAEARFVLVAPILRGLRRRGAREHGRRLGRLALESLRQRGGAIDGALALPMCLTATAQISAWITPLVIDFVTAAIAELAPGHSRRDGAHAFAERCPAVVDAAAAVFGATLTSDFTCRADWLERVLGLAPQPGWSSPRRSLGIPAEPSDMTA